MKAENGPTWDDYNNFSSVGALVHDLIHHWQGTRTQKVTWILAGAFTEIRVKVIAKLQRKQLAASAAEELISDSYDRLRNSLEQHWFQEDMPYDYYEGRLLNFALNACRDCWKDVKRSNQKFQKAIQSAINDGIIQVTDDQILDSDSQSTWFEDANETMKGCIDKLTNFQRYVADCFLGGMKQSEIAKSLNKSQGTIKKAFDRATAKLRNCMKKQGVSSYGA